VAPRRRAGRSILGIKASGKASTQIAVCVYGPDCCKKTSDQLGGADVSLESVRSLAEGINGVTVRAAGCLGQCKDGPSISVKLPGTPKREVLKKFSDVKELEKVLASAKFRVDSGVVKALQLKTRGNKAAVKGGSKEALKLYDEAITLLEKKKGTSRAKAGILSNRAGVKMALGDFDGAEQDINEAFKSDADLRQNFQRAGDFARLQQDEAQASSMYRDAGKADPQRKDMVEKGAKSVGAKTMFGFGGPAPYKLYDPA